MSLVAVTEPEFRKAEAVFRSCGPDLECRPAPAGEDALAEMVGRHGIRHVVVGVERYRGPLYEALAPGAVIARFGVGHDGIDKVQATRRGLLCTNTPGVLDDSVAEHAVNLILAAARHTPVLASQMKQGCWRPQVGRELAGGTLTVVGCGAIGRRVARIAALGFRMRVTGCDVAELDDQALRRDWGFRRLTADFAEAVGDADFVSLHIPATPATTGFIDHRRLRMLNPSAWLINTSRGAVVDEPALYDALVAGTLAGAALDVFRQEPYAPAAPGKDLRRLNNVVMTPHVGSSTQAACDRMAAAAIESIRLAERKCWADMPLLNPEVLRVPGGAPEEP